MIDDKILFYICLLTCILKVKTNLQRTESVIVLKDDEIQDRNETLKQLEGILEKTASRFALKIEEERRRLETNVDVEVQVMIPVSDFTQQADFIPINHNCERSTSNARQQIKSNIFKIN